MIILGIETSCDETAVAIVDDNKNILAHKINSQIDLHQAFGGVVPEIAARGHLEIFDLLIKETLKEANLNLKQIDAFAATSGPGLIGGVMIGMIAAKTLASIHKKPFLAINHLEAHALTIRLTSNQNFPYLLLLLSGGHCQILVAKEVGNYKKLGETIDDALGEAFDKFAKMLGFPYPGGPQIEEAAKNGDKNRFQFSKPLLDSKKPEHLCNFSFSGLKTALRKQIETLANSSVEQDAYKNLDHQIINDLCASFQRTIIEIIINRLENIFQHHQNELKEVSDIVIAGGVAANRYIFEELTNWANIKGLNLNTPPIKLCTDNAAMIAWAGIEKLKLGITDSLDFKPRSRWEL